jgi:transcription initiation factor TFIID TATA-box-binding protein
MRIREPKTTALGFSTGKVAINRAKSGSDAHLVARKFAKVLQKIGYEAECPDFKIHNIVACVDMKFISLEWLSARNCNFVASSWRFFQD